MRIGCLQFAPQVGEVANNIARAEAVLSKADLADLEGLDLLVLPEMAFSGYNFRSREHILPYLEPTGSGVSSQWARTTARKYACTVAVGYPEKAEEAEYYNSLVVIDKDGTRLAHTRKSFLYYTDEYWGAREGPGFYGGKLGDWDQVAMGICMDINPYKFEAPWDAYEFAFHVLRVRANLVILSTAWLTNDEQTEFISSPKKPDMHTITYWVRRFEPIIAAKSSEETIVVFANRCGVETEATYAGTSTVMGIKDGVVSVYGLLGRGVEELLVVDTDEPPFGRFVDREAPANGEPGAPPAEPTQDTEDEPSDGTGPSPGPGAANADSPTLPPTNGTPSTERMHTQPTERASSSCSPSSPPPSPPQRTSTQSRPKLSLLTNVGPFSAAPTEDQRTSPDESPPACSYVAYPSHDPPSAIPIIVDVYTPDDDSAAWHLPENDSAYYSLSGSGLQISLSPWSVSSRSAASSPRTTTSIPIAVSPSVLEGGHLSREVRV